MAHKATLHYVRQSLTLRKGSNAITLRPPRPNVHYSPAQQSQRSAKPISAAAVKRAHSNGSELYEFRFYSKVEVESPTAPHCTDPSTDGQYQATTSAAASATTTNTIMHEAHLTEVLTQLETSTTCMPTPKKCSLFGPQVNYT
jgi:hypothetical protein